MGQVPPKYFMPSAPYGASPAANVLNPTQAAAQNPQTPLLPPNFQDPGSMTTSQSVQQSNPTNAQSGNPFTGGGGMGRMFGRGLFGMLLLLFLSMSALATTTVTGTLQNLGTGTVGQGAFVRFWLRGCGGNQPRVSGTAVIAPSQGGVFFFDFAAASNGTVSGTLYSTRDATGLLGGDITCGTSTTSVWYGMQIFVGGKGGPEIPVHAKNGATLNISNVTTITTNPVITAPTGDTTYARLDAGNQPFLGSVQASGFNGVIKVDGVVYPFTNAGIQAAVNAAPDGGEVDLGPGTYVLTGTGPEEILITKRLNFICSGWDTILLVGASVPGTTDIIHLNPSALTQGGTIQDCYIKPASGSPGRHGISFDGTTSVNSNMRIIHNRIDALGGKSIAVINATGQATGTPFTTTFSDNVTQGGWDLTNAGDSLNIENNTMTGSGGLNVFLIGATVQHTSNGGAHGFKFIGNNFTNTGGIWIQNAWQGTIAFNDIEVATLSNISASAGNPCIDVDGNSNANIENVKIFGNFLACSNGGSSVDQIRVNRSNAAKISENFVARSVGVDYNITANAVLTQVMLNRHAPAADSINTFLTDSGTNTLIDYIYPTTNTRILSGTGFGTNTTSTPNFWFNGVQGRAGNTSLWCWSSGLDPSATGCDTGASKGPSAGIVSIGNGVAGDTSGEIRSQRIAATFNAAGTLQTAVHIVQDTCTLGSTCGVTLSGSAAFTNATSYTCDAQDTTAIAATRVNQTAGNGFTITGTGTDVIRYICVGN